MPLVLDGLLQDGEQAVQSRSQQHQPLLPTSLPTTTEPRAFSAHERPEGASSDKLGAFPPSDIFTADDETTAVSLGGWAEAAAAAPAGTSMDGTDFKLGSIAASSDAAEEGPRECAFDQNEDSSQLLLPASRQRRTRLKNQAERAGQRVVAWSGWLEQQLSCSVGGRNPSSASEGGVGRAGSSRLAPQSRHR